MTKIKDKSRFLLLFFSISLLITNILLIVQNFQLRKQIDNVKNGFIEAGQKLENFQEKDLDGLNSTNIQEKKRVYLFFKTTCGFCEKQMPFWKSLVKKIDYKDYEIIAVTTETDLNAIKNYLKKHEIQEWKVSTISTEDAQKAKLSVTPITFVVDQNRKVEKVWVGLWQSSDTKSASEYFRLEF